MNLVSKPLGGLLYGLRAFLPFLVDTVSYVVSVCSLFLIRKSFQEHRDIPRRHWWAEMSEGLHWLWNQPVLRIMALLTSVNIFLGAGQTLIIIVLAQQQQASSATIGLIFGIGSLGSILGAFLSGQVQRRFNFAYMIVGVLWLYAVFWLWLAILPPLFLLSLITALLFFIGPFYNVARTSRRLVMTPDPLQSRVNSVSNLISFGFAPLGLAFTGLLLQSIGPQKTILWSACGQVLLAVIATIVLSLLST